MKNYTSKNFITDVSVAGVIGALIGALIVVYASTCSGAEAKEPPKPDYWATIQNGELQVWSYAKPDHWLGRVKVEDWAKALGRLHSNTRNDKRHLVLNAAAAIVAGVGGGRSHTIDSLEWIKTYEEVQKNGGAITLTIELGTGFAIQKDFEDDKGNYRAEILMLSAKQLNEATRVKP